MEVARCIISISMKFAFEEMLCNPSRQHSLQVYRISVKRMGKSIIAFAGVSIVFIGFVTIVFLVIVKPALAQVDATSTESEVAAIEPIELMDASEPALEKSSTVVAESSETNTEVESEPVDALASEQPSESVMSSEIAPSEASPEGLTEVQIIGTKYIDYFTDGTNTYSFPGDPEIHAHLAKKDAPIPTHEGLTWVQSTGQQLYDTPSGDLEPGYYAVQANGTITANKVFVSSTSTPVTTSSVPELIATTSVGSLGAATTTEAEPIEASSASSTVPDEAPLQTENSSTTVSTP